MCDRRESLLFARVRTREAYDPNRKFVNVRFAAPYTQNPARGPGLCVRVERVAQFVLRLRSGKVGLLERSSTSRRKSSNVTE